MSSVIGSLRVDLGLDSAKFERGAGAAQKQLAKMRKQFVGVTSVVAAMGAALTAAALKGAQQIDQAAKSARRLDSSIGGFEALKLAASEAGVSLSGLANDLQTMNRELSSIGTSGNGKRALDALGLSIKDLQGLDADEKLAVIADQVKSLGLSSGQTTAVLRDLGIRNREMALLVLQGGDAIRAAREDIRAYGLEVSAVDASRIEAANDQLGRLGLITQYAGQQLAIALVPALGAMAQAMTDSLKAGGLLRAMIDGFTDNLNEIAGVALVATTAFGTRYVGAMVAARLATLNFATALGVMKKALIRTGIGALIVGAGVMVGKFLDLVQSAGGFGKALTLLGEVAGKVWQGIVASAAAIPPALSGVWQLMKSGFLLALSDMATGFFDFTWNIANGLSGVPAFEGMSASLMKLADGANAASGSLARAGYEAKAAADGAFSSAAGTIREAFGPARKAMEKLSGVTVETTETTDDLNDTLDDTETSGGKAAKGAGKAADEIKRAKTEAEAFADTLKEAAFTAEDLGTEKANILVGGVDGVANAFGDFIAQGFQNFKGFAKSILDTFTGMISQMIAMAAKNRIMLSMGFAGGGAGGAAAAGVPGPGGAVGSLMNSVMGAAGIGSALVGGFTNAASALFTSGIGSMATTIGAQVGTAVATGTATSIAAAAGAVALPVLAVVAAVSFFKKKVTELDSGIRIMAEGTDLTLKQFKKLETKRFWGLSKKVSMQFEDLDAATAGPLEAALSGIQMNVVSMADALGVAAETFDDFSIEIDAATKGLSEADAAAKIEEVIGNFANNFAVMIPGLDYFTTAGENMYQTLIRVVGSLQTVNQMFDRLGFGLLDMSIEGAKASESLVAMFGSLENLNTAATEYYQRFYSDTERAAQATLEVRDAMAQMGIVMPATIEGFRALVDQAERMGDLNRVGDLIKLSGAFAAAFDARVALQGQAEEKATSDLQAAFAREQAATRAAFQSAIDGLQNELTSARERLANSRAISEALTSALGKRIFPDMAAQRQSQDQAAAYLQSLVGLSQISDLNALQDALQIVANPSTDTYETLQDYRRDFFATSGVIRALKDTAGLALTADQQAVVLLEQQIAAMQAQSDAAVNLLQQQLDALMGVSEGMQSLATAISAFKAATGGGEGGSGSGGGGSGGGSSGGTWLDSSNRRALEKVYQEELGRAPDAAGLDFWTEQARNLTIPEIREHIRKSQEALTGVIPQFARGGLHSGGWRLVGERGPELEYTGPSQIVSHDRSRSLMDNSELVAEMRQMRADMARLVSQAQQSATYIKRTSDATEYLANDSKASA
ncbi:hypothetical protein [Sulfitobacter sp. MOLA879]|uniref:hypothetical protein n=1 Tax=Sulfitobacter sp. MOLA879 TaxID=3368579 RepID=UPI003744BACE